MSLLRRTHLDDQVSLGVTGHSAELSGQLLELRPAVCVNHPAWRGERRSREGCRGVGRGQRRGKIVREIILTQAVLTLKICNVFSHDIVWVRVSGFLTFRIFL